MSASALSVQPQPRHPATARAQGGRGQRQPRVQQTLLLAPLVRPCVTAREGYPDPAPPSPHPATQVATSLPRAPGGLPRQPSLLTGLALAGRVQVVVRAQQLALAVGPAVIYARGQKSSQPHLRGRVSASHEPAHKLAVTWRSGASFPVRHRGPAPLAETPPLSPRPRPAQGAQGQEPCPCLRKRDSQPGHSGGGTDREEEAGQGL